MLFRPEAIPTWRGDCHARTVRSLAMTSWFDFNNTLEAKITAGAGIARAGDAGPGSLEKEEEKRRGTPFDLHHTTRALKVLDGCPTLPMRPSDSALSVF
jgi:hypothetical protein